jgi:hypothetical protein
MPQQKATRHIPTTGQILAEQKLQARKDTEAAAKALAPIKSTAVAVPDSRSEIAKYLDEIAPASIVGRLVKFGKEGRFVTHDDGETVSDNIDHVALCDQTLIGYIKFNGEGTPPDRIMGLLYDGFRHARARYAW